MSYISDSPSDSSDNDLDEDGGLLIQAEHAMDAPITDDETECEEAPQAKPLMMAARAYQLEMFAASMKENVIVARVWFLAPKVALCEQQHAVIQAQIPNVVTKLLIGADNVDAWTEQSVWDEVLAGVRVVVSTHQILLDALLHSFVGLEDLSLLVFDEVHHASGNHASNRIMQEKYWPLKEAGKTVPHVLGLTASPVKGSSLRSMRDLESRMDAVCRSPTQHREELLAQVDRPTMRLVQYEPGDANVAILSVTASIASLRSVLSSLNIEEDPYVVRLLQEKTERAKRQLEAALMNNKTYVQETMRKFFRRSLEILRELGPWAADYYIYSTVKRIVRDEQTTHVTNDMWYDEDLKYLIKVLAKVQLTHRPLSEPKPNEVTDKVSRLIDVLADYPDKPFGIIFVKERATTAVLSHLLSQSSRLRDRYKTGAMVGTSNQPGVKQDFLDLGSKDGHRNLDAFRSGRLNLVVATTVLEEGIDIPACNLIVCVDLVESLRQYIQRRGRARMRGSHMCMLVASGSDTAVSDWSMLEVQMKRQYEDETRELQLLEHLEDEELEGYPDLRVESTGAHLTINDAKSHLQHFCSTLYSRKFVDSNPDYIAHEVAGTSVVPKNVKGQLQQQSRPLLRADVLLPVSLPPHLRRASSLKTWSSEKGAFRDAAFQAYTMLFDAGLINDNLLPFKNSDMPGDVESRPSMMMVRDQADPWMTVCQGWQAGPATLHARTVEFKDQDGLSLCKFQLCLPVSVPEMDKLVLWWDQETSYSLDFGDSQSRVTTAEFDSVNGMLNDAFSHRWKPPDGQYLLHISSPDLNASIPTLLQLVNTIPPTHLVRGPLPDAAPWFLQACLQSKPAYHLVQRHQDNYAELPDNATYLAVRRWPKVAGLYHPPKQRPLKSDKPYQQVFCVDNMSVDRSSLTSARLGLFLPAITHFVEVHLIASDLMISLLAPLELSSCPLVAQALTATMAIMPFDYERLEFLGDSMLKLCASVHCAASKLHWHEMMLSQLKDSLVCNARLCRATVESGLDQYIVNKALAQKKWRPRYVNDVLACMSAKPKERELSSKVLADVLEAIIGVCYLEGGLPKVLKCIKLFIPEMNWSQDLSLDRDTLFDAALTDRSLPKPMRPVEGLIGYSFQCNSLLTAALTHPSYNVPGTDKCYDRLEFLGDAILDYIVVREIYIVQPALRNYEMHLLRTCLVNGDVLAFFMMEWTCTQRASADVQLAASNGLKMPAEVRTTPREVATPLWSYMRHSNADLVREQQRAAQRHAQLRTQILEAIQHGTRYPWATLLRLRAPKFFSDVYEALVGAIWIDSGSFETCKAFVEKSGVLPYLRRILKDGVHCLHPKEEIGRLADRWKVTYVVEKVLPKHQASGSDDGLDFDEEVETYNCTALVGEREVVTVKDALWKEEAQTMAATAAVDILKAEVKEMGKIQVGTPQNRK